MKQIIDIETWERKNNYQFFSTFLNPDYSIAVEVECGNAMAVAKSKGQSFFLYYLYAMLRAANEVKELRYRNENGNVVLYDQLDAVSPITVGENGRFVEVRIPYHEDFSTFYQTAQQIVRNVPKDKDAYADTQVSGDVADFGKLLVSALPGLRFTAVGYTQLAPQVGSPYPLSQVGKMIQHEGKNYIPIAITINHAFVDGFHLTAFFGKIESYLLSL